MISQRNLALSRSFAAEFIGTFFLALTVGFIFTGGLLSEVNPYEKAFVPLAVGMLVTAMIYLFGPVSGAQFNPSVTVGLYVIGKIPAVKAGIHLVAQIIAAYAGIAVVMSLAGVRPEVVLLSSTTALWGEVLGAFVLVATVTSAVLGKIEASVAPIAIGIALTAGITVSLVASGGVLNPALSLALGGYHIPYVVGPLLGGILAAACMKWIYGEYDKHGQHDL